MSDTLNYQINFNFAGAKVLAIVQNINNNFDKLTKSIDNSKKASEAASQAMQKGFSMVKLDAFLNNIDRAAQGLKNIAQPGLSLSSNMAELSAITGVTGKKFQEIEGFARANAKTFGGTASQSAESYKLILSQLNPKIAETPAALQAMGSSVSTLSKLMGGNAVAATEVLTTAMNQFQVSTTDPIAASKEMGRMMDIMAAAAQAGSAELPAIKQALEASGLAAKSAGLSFEETNAAIQVLDKSGKKGAEGGVALRNILATLSEGRFLPKETQAELKAAGVSIDDLGNTSLSLKDRLSLLQKIMGDGALVTKLFGKDNQNAALAVISNTELLEQYTTASLQVGSAAAQAAIIMESPAEKASRLQAKIDDLKITMFNATSGIWGYISAAADLGKTVGDISPIFTMVGGALSFLTNTKKMAAAWTSILTFKTKILSITMYSIPIFWIILGIVALIAIIYYLGQKFSGWGKLWSHVVQGAKYTFEAFTEGIKWKFNTVIDGIMIGLNIIKKGWYEFKEAVGLGDSEENKNIISQINADTDRRKKEITDGAKKVSDLESKATLEFKEAFTNSLKNNEKVTIKSVTEDTKKKFGISNQPVVPTNKILGGKASELVANNNDKTKKTTNDKASATANSIATGGTKSTIINIKIGNMVDKMSISSATGRFSEAANQIVEQVEDALVRVLAGAAATAG